MVDIDMETGRAAGGRDVRDAGLGSLTDWRPTVRSRPQMLSSGSYGGVTSTETFNYPPELPALTAEQQALLQNRRRMATRQRDETVNTAQREMDRQRGNVFRQESDLQQQQAVRSREGMQTLAGRGVGRSPMFVNPLQRRLTQETQRQVGELQSGLAGILSNLEAQIRQAEINRERELQQVDWDRTAFRSDINALLGV